MYTLCLNLKMQCKEALDKKRDVLCGSIYRINRNKSKPLCGVSKVRIAVACQGRGWCLEGSTGRSPRMRVMFCFLIWVLVTWGIQFEKAY